MLSKSRFENCLFLVTSSFSSRSLSAHKKVLVANEEAALAAFQQQLAVAREERRVVLQQQLEEVGMQARDESQLFGEVSGLEELTNQLIGKRDLAQQEVMNGMHS